MIFVILSCVLLSILKNHKTDSLQLWDYGLRNPNLWPHLDGELFEQCGKEKQSPINIRKVDVICDRRRSVIRPIELNSGYEESAAFNFTNSQLTLLASVQNAAGKFSLSGSGLPSSLSPFNLAQFHFHWGQHTFEGSEHTIEHKYSPLEVHFVHVSTVDPSYFAVIGVLFELSSEPNANLETIIRAADYLATSPHSSYFEKVNVTSLLPETRDRFYYYEGSLTIPPCTEKVLWTVMADKIPISQDQLNHIYRNPTKFNFRPVQPLNKRSVRTLSCDLAGHELSREL